MLFEFIWFYVCILFMQARATLIHILELQIQHRKQALEDIKKYVPKELKNCSKLIFLPKEFDLFFEHAFNK